VPVSNASCGGSLYIDWRMVVVVGRNVLHHVQREGKCPGWEISEGYVRGKSVQGEMSYTRRHAVSVWLGVRLLRSFIVPKG